ncbi:hypothetical protein IKU74_03815 [bacterium]|nr:hypothetical protein [bacterium]
MGKTSSTPVQKYANGIVSVNGENKASQKKIGKTVYSNYNMSDAEKQIYDYSQNSFLQNLPNINIFSENTQKNLQDQLNAYTQTGLNTIQNYYNPMLSNLKTDIASRFGNFDNSVFLDKLNSIEANRANAMSDFAQDVTAKRNELINDELANRYKYLNFLSGIQNQYNSNILGYLNQAGNVSASGTYNSTKQTDNSNDTMEYVKIAASVLASLYA